MLLSDLYMRALKVLEQGDYEAVDPARRLNQVKNAIRKQLAGRDVPEPAVEDFLGAMPERYFLTVPEGDITIHFDMMQALRENGAGPMVCRHRHFPKREFSEFVVAPDQPGLFAKIAGVLTANNLNILSARITTRSDDLVLDVFRLSHLPAGSLMVMEEERWQRVGQDLEQVLSGARDVAEMVSRFYLTMAARRRFVRRVPTEVTVDNRSSEQYTVIDVFTQDRIGLLFTITHTIFKLGLVIHLARISTNADQALDVFYVSDGHGRKITAPGAFEELRSALVQRLEGEPAGDGPK
jgi:[protein-PII] uridylyltransferase